MRVDLRRLHTRMPAAPKAVERKATCHPGKEMGCRSMMITARDCESELSFPRTKINLQKLNPTDPHVGRQNLNGFHPRETATPESSTQLS